MARNSAADGLSSAGLWDVDSPAVEALEAVTEHGPVGFGHDILAMSMTKSARMPRMWASKAQ
jgi:hypothetical protein